MVAKWGLGLLILLGPCNALSAQSLAPRAYVITPQDANAITVTWSYYSGGVNFNGTIPITGATGTYSVPVLSYYRSFSFFGRSANITGFLPYGVGTFQGSVLGTHRQVYRSGLLDLGFRFSVNLKGGPAMRPQEFAKWKQKMLLGVSVTVIPPTGQYDPMHLVNWASTDGLSNRNSGIRSAGGIGCWMGTEGCGSTPQTTPSTPFRSLNLRPRTPSGLSRVI